MLFEKLSNEDKEKFSNYIYAYGLSPEHNMPSKSTRASLEYVLRHWDREKQDLYRLLGGNFILQKHINLDVDTQLIYNKLQEMYTSSKILRDRQYCDIFRHFYVWLYDIERAHRRYIRELRAKLCAEHKDYEQLMVLQDDWFSLEHLASNAYSGPVGILMLPDTDKTTLKYINSRISKLDKEKSELLDDIKKLKLDKQKKSSLNHKVLRDAMSKWDELSFDDKRSVIEVLIEKILVFPDKVEIHWKV